MKAVLPAIARRFLESHLPASLDIVWVSTVDEAIAATVDADIAWVDLPPHGLTGEAVAQGVRLRWLSTAIAGLDSLDFNQLRERGTIVTNGAGINAIAVAEYAVMGILVAAKRYDAVVRAADRHEWLTDPPGRVELYNTRALIIGMGAIGTLVGERLRAFGVAVTGVTRSGRGDTLTADAWKSRVGEFDWIVLAAPSTGETKALIDADTLAAMKSSAWLVNVARGDMIDDDALIAALHAKTIAGALLDPTEPEPLPTDHPLWTAPNALITMHLSGRSQTKMFSRAGAMFLRNLDSFLNDRPMENLVDLAAGY